ncbi:MAG TPA: molybdate ABC transporter substrate-binding protein [Steroidobacteraceae bacterium]|nr:molybdate ABC transporter substrate-binding protein [Steroidobacteraceae bacterium]
MGFWMTRRASSFVITLLAAIAPLHAEGAERRELLVFAAASLTDVLGEISRGFEQQGGLPVKLAFAASSVLARQVEAGGQAEVFISADPQWMDYLEERHLIDTATRRDLVGNRLVLIAPADSRIELRIAPGFPLLAALGGGRLSTGDPDIVPAGRYARSALVSLGLWDEVRNRLARADNVRSALMFVSRGEAPLGIVYATDALLDSRVRIVDTFPANTHAPITYPGAALRGARPEAIAYLNYLASPQVGETWRRFGFVELKK